ncbi:dopamine receptor 3-like [Octopus vulgaris]|uniref:Dopamine receptor 3-like n=1 Tax=Octopus vulgaris TaxID=6645 RepID=A0AA36FB88_OCTVU|nr:dopamine receptor 3-like [Octopus vulgaris]
MELYDYTIYGLRNFYRTYKSSKYQQELYFYLLYITISLTVLLPNLLLVVVLLRKIKKGDTRPLDKLLLNICISSSLWGIFGHLVFAHLYYFRWNIGVAFCKVYYTVLVGFDIAFQFHMFAISIDRVLQATNPYRYLQRVNNFGSSLLLYIPCAGIIPTFWFIDRDIRNAITKQINEMVLKITRGSEKSETQKTIPIDFSDN